MRMVSMSFPSFPESRVDKEQKPYRIVSARKHRRRSRFIRSEVAEEPDQDDDRNRNTEEQEKNRTHFGPPSVGPAEIATPSASDGGQARRERSDEKRHHQPVKGMGDGLAGVVDGLALGRHDLVDAARGVSRTESRAGRDESDEVRPVR